MTKTKTFAKLLITAAILLVIIGLSLLVPEKRRLNRVHPESIRCYLDLTRSDDTSDFLLAGYNYALLKRFASDNNIEIDIRNLHKGASLFDSLTLDKAQIGVLPFTRKSEVPDSVLISFSLDSMSLWVIPEGTLEQVFENWVWNFFNSSANDSLRHIYTEYEPILMAKRGEKTPVLGPYDDLIKSNATELGWDWRLLAAVIFQESRFRLASRSSKGAEGLMQIIPATASRYNADNILEPETNIRTGVLHLKRMSRLFRQRSANQDELRKIALAAYNAGERHINECILYAEENELEYRYWDSLVNVIYRMGQDNSIDTLQYSRFRYMETVNYVKRVYDYYWAFSKIYDPAIKSD